MKRNAPTRKKLLQAFIELGPSSQAQILSHVYPVYHPKDRTRNSYFAISDRANGHEVSLVLRGLITRVGTGPRGTKIYQITAAGIAEAHA